MHIKHQLWLRGKIICNWRGLYFGAKIPFNYWRHISFRYISEFFRFNMIECCLEDITVCFCRINFRMVNWGFFVRVRHNRTFIILVRKWLFLLYIVLLYSFFLCWLPHWKSMVSCPCLWVLLTWRLKYSIFFSLISCIYCCVFIVWMQIYS